MLHNTFMFCSIIFISTNLGLHWCHVQKCLQNIRSNYRELRQITEILIINFDERYTGSSCIRFMHQIFFKRYEKSIPCNNLRRRSDVNIFLRHVGVNRNPKLHHKYSLTFGDLSSECSATNPSSAINLFFCSINVHY
jgi:hypothetical protein